ncbi:Auxin response factor 7 [Zea mays]|uniref:Auxin response factor n=2 Tax=Zea mays TaxID=4577 RepID=A0A1D6MEU8_MAIZE|nr:Auxin response factor 7 [Zea mays]ONM28167.1 Auxin response factor 7 [Zea mays]
MAQGAGRDPEELFEELWRACAGPLVELPQTNERVFYFLQGHLEQLQEPTDPALLAEQIKMFQVPNKILCKVVNVELKARRDRNGRDVRPDHSAAGTRCKATSQVDLPQLPEPPLQETSRPVVHSFCKILTPSDTSTHGGFSVLRRHANECLPALDMSMPTPTQELITKDLHGSEWRFKHIYRGQPRRHLLTTGWSTFVTSKKLIAGDAFVYLRSETGQQRVGVRRLVQKQSTMPASVISSQSMHLGVLASASHAIRTHSIFLVYYRPRLSQSQYIVRLNKYLESSKIGFDVGMRFKMSFEGDDVPIKKFSGTVVDKGDLSPQWQGSEWKTLKVKWDEATNLNGPERVSSWEIEPFDASAPAITMPVQPSMKNKRPRETAEGLDIHALEPAQEFWLSGRPEQHEKTSVSSSEPKHQVAWTSERAGYSAMSSSICQNSAVTGSWFKGFNSSGSHPSLPEISQKLFQVTSNDARVPPWPGLSAYHADEPSSKLSCNTALCSYQTEEVAPRFSNAVEEEKKEPGMFRLFGVNLINHARSSATADKTSVGAGETSARAAGSFEDSAQLSRVTKDHTHMVNGSPREIQSHQSCSGRSRIKVQMHGNDVCRAVDLGNLDGYEQLMGEVGEMFEIKDLGSKEKEEWKVTFINDENETMEVGAVPWQEFCQMVRKIVIHSIGDRGHMEACPCLGQDGKRDY